MYLTKYKAGQSSKECFEHIANTINSNIRFMIYIHSGLAIISLCLDPKNIVLQKRYVHALIQLVNICTIFFLRYK